MDLADDSARGRVTAYLTAAFNFGFALTVALGLLHFVGGYRGLLVLAALLSITVARLVSLQVPRQTAEPSPRPTLG